MPAKTLFEVAQRKQTDLLHPNQTGLCARYYLYLRVKAKGPSTDQAIHGQTDPDFHLSTLRALEARDLKLSQVRVLDVLAKSEQALRQMYKGRDLKDG